MILKMIRSFALLNLKNKMQSALLVSFVSDVFLHIITVFAMSKINMEMIEDLLYYGQLPVFPAEQMRTFWILLGLFLVFTPIFKMGAIKFYLHLNRHTEPHFQDVFYYIGKPWKAWGAYIALALLYALWTFVPVLLIFLLHQALPGIFTLQVTSFMVTLGYIPLFYARLRYFAFIYILADEQEKSYIKAAKRSAQLFRNNGIGVLSMLLYFTFFALVLELVASWLGFLGIMGDVLSRFVMLMLSAWMATSFAALYGFINKESMFVEIQEKENENMQEFYQRILRELQARQQAFMDQESRANESKSHESLTDSGEAHQLEAKGEDTEQKQKEDQ